MTFFEQCKVIACAAEHSLLTPSEIQRWADSMIAAVENPPFWLLDLSILRSIQRADYISVLREHSAPPSPELRIEVIIQAHRSARLQFEATLSTLYDILFCQSYGSDLPDSKPLELLSDLLVEWDCQDEAGACEVDFRTRAEQALAAYPLKSSGITSILDWPSTEPG